MLQLFVMSTAERLMFERSRVCLTSPPTLESLSGGNRSTRVSLRTNRQGNGFARSPKMIPSFARVHAKESLRHARFDLPRRFLAISLRFAVCEEKASC